jgi:hypothetical protein
MIVDSYLAGTEVAVHNDGPAGWDLVPAAAEFHFNGIVYKAVAGRDEASEAKTTVELR